MRALTWLAEPTIDETGIICSRAERYICRFLDAIYISSNPQTNSSFSDLRVRELLDADQQAFTLAMYRNGMNEDSAVALARKTQDISDTLEYTGVSH